MRISYEEFCTNLLLLGWYELEHNKWKCELGTLFVYANIDVQRNTVVSYYSITSLVAKRFTGFKHALKYIENEHDI